MAMRLGPVIICTTVSILSAGVFGSGCSEQTIKASPTRKIENSASTITPTPKETESTRTPTPTVIASDYQIVEKKDVSSPTAIRLVYRIVVDAPQSEAQLRLISEDVIQKQSDPVNATSIFFYLKGTDTSGPYSAGNAIWAPDGLWEHASYSRAGDYSKHKLSIAVGSALGKWQGAVETVTTLSLAEKKEIYYELVRVQDSGVKATASYEAIAARYGLTVQEVQKIAIEGSLNLWPIPPLP